MSTEGIGGFLGESSIESLNSGAEGRVADPVVVSSVTGGHGRSRPRGSRVPWICDHLQVGAPVCHQQFPRGAEGDKGRGAV